MLHRVSRFYRGSLKSSLAVCFLSVCLGAAASAQDRAVLDSVPSPPSQAAFGLTVGLGNVLGGFGASAERYFMDGRASAALGAGYLPSDGNRPGIAGFGAAVRRYFGSGKHQAFLELSVSPITLSTTFNGVVVESDANYGPGLAAGYRRTADGGFHFDFNLGVGWAGGAGGAAPIGALGVGHTWRR